MSRQKRIAAWEDFDYPLEAGDEIIHTLAEDIRKHLYLMTVGKYANADNTSEPSGVYGEESQAGYWGGNGPFREGNAFSDYGTGGLNPDDRRGPGFVDIWFDESWGPYDIVGATQNYGGSGVHEVWFEDENIDSAGDETVNGNLTNKCPLEITGVDADTAELNGFWRIKTTRQVNVSGTIYVLAQLQDFHEDSELVLLNDRGHPGTSYTKGGAAACDFGGDWYMFCPRASRDGNVSFASDADMLHKYPGNARGDDEKRPPDGGKFSWDNTAWWTRTVNPYRYHHYDYNAHRWIGFAQRRGDPLVNYYTVLGSWRMLPINTDPKERAAPHWYKDTSRLAWQIAGNKVEIQKEQLTDWSAMLAVQGSQSQLRTDPSNLVRTTDVTYQTVTWGADETLHYGIYPPVANDGLNNQHEVWHEHKMDTRCIWAWIELAARTGKFVAQVNDAYKTNWLEKNRKINDAISIAGDPGGTTYEDKWHNGSWNLDGYRPKYNSTQTEWDYLYSEFWGENGSAIEKLLSDLGDYDWWYDTSAKYVPYTIKHLWGNIYHEQANNHEDPGEVGIAAAEWEVPTPHGTWRKVPKYSMGYVDGDEATDPGVTGFMRDKESGTPDGAEIDDFVTLVHNSLERPLVGTEWYNFCSLYSKQAPANGEYGNYATNLKDRHGPIHTHGDVSYYERAVNILNHMLDVLDSMQYVDGQGDATVEMIGNLYGADQNPPDFRSLTGPDEVVLRDIVVQDMIDNYPDVITYDDDPLYDELDELKLQYGFMKQRNYVEDPWPEDWIAQSPSPFDEVEIRIALRFSSLNKSEGYHEGFFRIKLGKVVTGAPAWIELGEVLGIDKSIIIQDEDYDIYRWMYFADFPFVSGSYAYWDAKLANNPMELQTSSDTELLKEETAWSEVPLTLIGGFYLIFAWDVSLFSDEIWERDDTYAKKSLLDPTEDIKPPVHEPIKLFLSPTIYDTNRPEEDLIGECYSRSIYVPEWHIKMSSILMVDLEDNGVEYEFVGEGGTGDPTAEDFTSSEQSDKEYDFILDMGVANSNEVGNEQDLEEAIDNGLVDWTFKVRAKDDASAAGVGQTDNYTEYSDNEQIVADEDQICSPIGLWSQLPVGYDGNVDMSIKEAFGPLDDRDCEYKFEYAPPPFTSWSVGQDWNSNNEFSHTGEEGSGYGYRCSARTVTGQITSVVSETLTES